jgi:undecaprenyl-diphosphatase
MRRAGRLLTSAGRLDESLLRRAVSWGRRGGVMEWMRLASRLGDGPAWYAAGAIALVAGGPEGRRMAFEGLAAAALDALVYRGCKARFVRLRPFMALPDLPILWSPPHDFSFPSGHAMHAFAWATLIALHFPGFALPAIAFAACIALSRVVLAVHYPSDALAGAAIGSAIALLTASAL